MLLWLQVFTAFFSVGLFIMVTVSFFREERAVRSMKFQIKKMEDRLAELEMQKS